MPNTDLLNKLEKGLLVWDGAMGTQTQNLDLDVDEDYEGCENCTDILSLTRPDQVAEIHRSYFKAGADVVTTNTFGAAAHTLGEFDRADDAERLAHDAAKIAREVADEFQTEDQPRFVAGSLGPGTKLITLGQIEFAAMRESYAKAAKGLISGGADAILLETCQDPLQIKCVVQGIEQAADELGFDLDDIPILVSITIEQTGTMLVGAAIESVIETLRPLPISSLGLNCATGPSEMLTHVRVLAQKWDKPITLMPNAGLPVLQDGETVYPWAPRRSPRRSSRSSRKGSSTRSAAAAAPRPSTSPSSARSRTRGRRSRVPSPRSCPRARRSTARSSTARTGRF